MLFKERRVILPAVKFRIKATGAAVLASLTCFATLCLGAATWDPSIQSGSWSVGSNWLGGVAPVSGSTTIAFNDALAHSITYDGSYNASTISVGGTITLGNVGSGAATLQFDADRILSAYAINVGVDGRAAINQSIGTVAFAYGSFGAGAGGVATYNLSGGTFLAHEALIGVEGTGGFNQSGGLIRLDSPADQFRVGTSAGIAIYTINDGIHRNAGLLEAGGFGAGTIIQNGGLVVLSSGDGVIGLHVKPIGSGGYFLNGGTLNAGAESIFRRSFVQSSGMNIVGIGTIAGTLRVFSTGSYTLTGGTLSVNGTELIQGTLTQSAGIHFVGNEAAPSTLISQGNMRVAGFATLTVVGTETVGGGGGSIVPASGTITIAGNSHHQLGTMESPSRLRIGSDSTSVRGVLNLSSLGRMDVFGDELVGDSGTGTFNQSSGMHALGTAASAGTLYLGYTATGKGNFDLSGGTLLVHGAEYIGHDGAGTFTHAYGLNQVNGLMRIGTAGSYLYTGGTIQINGTLDIRGNFRSDLAQTDRKLRTSSLLIADAGNLDLGNDGMIVDYPNASPIDSIVAYLRKGYNGGAWNGSGGISSLEASFEHTRGVGYADDDDAITLSYSFAGDATLDGMVDIQDLYALASHWQSPAYWSAGDFDYDRLVSATDLAILARNWQLGTGATPGAPLSAILASLGLPDVAVPEPSIISLSLMTLLSVLRRRRRVASAFI